MLANLGHGSTPEHVVEVLSIQFNVGVNWSSAGNDYCVLTVRVIDVQVVLVVSYAMNTAIVKYYLIQVSRKHQLLTRSWQPIAWSVSWNSGKHSENIFEWYREITCFSYRLLYCVIDFALANQSGVHCLNSLTRCRTNRTRSNFN